MPSLDRAVALEEVDDLAARVAEDLEFDVARLLDVLLEEEAIVAERLHGLAPRRLELRLQLAALADDLHPLPAAPRARLHEDREADALRLGGEHAVRLRVAVVAGDDGDAEPSHQVPRVRLRAHGLDGVGARPDEDDLRLLARGGERGALRQKAVAGMDGIGAGVARGIDDAVDVEVALQRNDVVEEAADEADVVVLGVAEDGADAHLAAGAGDADGDFAAVGHQYGVDHGRVVEFRISNFEFRIENAPEFHSEFLIRNSKFEIRLSSLHPRRLLLLQKRIHSRLPFI